MPASKKPSAGAAAARPPKPAPKKRAASPEPPGSPVRKSLRVRPKVEYNEDKLAKLEHAEEPQSSAAYRYKSPATPPPKPATVSTKRQPIPKRNAAGELVFPDFPAFRPNLTPKEVMQAGSFGGTYFRPIKSGITGVSYGADEWKEFPADWFTGLHIGRRVTSSTYREDVNTYKVKCGGDLDMWESSGWINACDPYGWFQWYCRFYLGRRTDDDERQIGRGLRCFSPTGRWRIRLCNEINKRGRKFDDATVSPVIRQTLQHWGFRLTEQHYRDHCKKYGLKP